MAQPPAPGAPNLPPGATCAAKPPTESPLKRSEKKAVHAAKKALKKEEEAFSTAPKKKKVAPFANVEQLFIEVPEGHKKGQ